MHEPPDELLLRQALRDGLQALPPVTPDFDARILDALRAPTPWWRRLWEPARPLLLGASCSLLVTLALLHWTLSGPAPQPPILGEPESIQAAVPARTPLLDGLLDRPGLRAGSLAAAWGSALSRASEDRPLTPTPIKPNSGGTGEEKARTHPGSSPAPPELGVGGDLFRALA